MLFDIIYTVGILFYVLLYESFYYITLFFDICMDFSKKMYLLVSIYFSCPLKILKCKFLPSVLWVLKIEINL
ncbi:hypothetical protein MmiEs2_02340 [Methanimicrococcus stummii]|uniref:Uncharacterized protein n=1 Tax=Methanimicrococcus stummii TaxID=3028294 RepID=A0AA96ZWQ1_9EURY|nr:hypothetical protein MmiEs2_02340 [Methanimicrococcus sp. Es2]